MDRVSAMVLAGGFSSRMGSSKAELMLGSRSLIALQTDKLKHLGIRDIMLSGYPKKLPGTRTVPDEYPHRGPISGIHACLHAAVFPACLAIAVDTPLVPDTVLSRLIQEHTEGITILEHAGKLEPLMAVYDCTLAEHAASVLHSEKPRLMNLLANESVHIVSYTGDEALLSNCNTPEEYAHICTLWEVLRPSETYGSCSLDYDSCSIRQRIPHGSC